jgi:hypothetical protein
LTSPNKNTNPLKAVTTIALVLVIISYATGTVPLALAFELSAPNKNLQVQWWKWILGIPADESPATDDTGEFCDQDQKGPIWYLAGIAGSSGGLPGGSATRNCNVPEGKDILIPIFNTVCAEITDAGLIKQELGLEQDDEIPPSQLKEGLVRCTDFFLDALVEEDNHFSIDGKILANEDFEKTRLVSPQFQIVYPDGNVFNQSPTNVKQKAVADGLWILIKDLEPGEHTIEASSHLHFDDPLFDFQTSVTYHLTIEGKNTFPLSNEDNNPVLSKFMGNPVQTNPSVGASVMDKLMLN